MFQAMHINKQSV